MVTDLASLGVGPIGVPSPYSSIVVVGNGFVPGMLDYHELFGGMVDPSSVMLAGPHVRCAYENGRCSFSITPDRIDLRAHSMTDIMPSDLIESTKFVFQVIDGVRSMVQVTGIGLNFDGGFSVTQRTGESPGLALCHGLFKRGLLSSISNTSPRDVWTSVVLSWAEDGLYQSVRIEPENASNGANVYIAINGHKPITSQERIEPVLRLINTFRHQVASIHARIGAT